MKQARVVKTAQTQKEPKSHKPVTRFGDFVVLTNVHYDYLVKHASTDENDYIGPETMASINSPKSEFLCQGDLDLDAFVTSLEKRGGRVTKDYLRS